MTLVYIYQLTPCRCRLVPVFGTTIRRFKDNVSELKQTTASDFEDLLQVSFYVIHSESILTCKALLDLNPCV